jgi:type I restriction enzyme S subunit
MPRANWDVLIEYPLHVPPDPLLEEFNDIANDIVAQVHNLVMRNRNLSATRDLLLPKLVSGEVDVSKLNIEVPES